MAVYGTKYSPMRSMLMRRESSESKQLKNSENMRKLFGSVKDFDKNIFREDSRQSRCSKPKIKMIRQGRTPADEEKDAKISVLTRKGEKIPRF